MESENKVQAVFFDIYKDYIPDNDDITEVIDFWSTLLDVFDIIEVVFQKHNIELTENNIREFFLKKSKVDDKTFGAISNILWTLKKIKNSENPLAAHLIIELLRKRSELWKIALSDIMITSMNREDVIKNAIKNKSEKMNDIKYATMRKLYDVVYNMYQEQKLSDLKLSPIKFAKKFQNQDKIKEEAKKLGIKCYPTDAKSDSMTMDDFKKKYPNNCINEDQLERNVVNWIKKYKK